jgi:hypothetical protein
MEFHVLITSRPSLTSTFHCVPLRSTKQNCQQDWAINRQRAQAETQGTTE